MVDWIVHTQTRANDPWPRICLSWIWSLEMIDDFLRLPWVWQPLPCWIFHDNDSSISHWNQWVEWKTSFGCMMGRVVMEGGFYLPNDRISINRQLFWGELPLFWSNGIWFTSKVPVSEYGLSRYFVAVVGMRSLLRCSLLQAVRTGFPAVFPPKSSYVTCCDSLTASSSVSEWVIRHTKRKPIRGWTCPVAHCKQFRMKYKIVRTWLAWIYREICYK